MPPNRYVGGPTSKARKRYLIGLRGSALLSCKALAAGRGCSNLKGKARVPNQRTKKQKEVSLQTERTNKIRRAAKRKERDTKDMS